MYTEASRVTWSSKWSCEIRMSSPKVEFELKDLHMRAGQGGLRGFESVDQGGT